MIPILGKSCVKPPTGRCYRGIRSTEMCDRASIIIFLFLPEDFITRMMSDKWCTVGPFLRSCLNMQIKSELLKI